jgi:hypothetical protein
MLIVTNKMQRNTIFFIVVKALHVPGGFPAQQQAQQTPDAACTVFELLILGGKPPETRKALTTIKNIVLRCILLVTISI